MRRLLYARLTYHLHQRDASFCSEFSSRLTVFVCATVGRTSINAYLETATGLSDDNIIIYRCRPKIRQGHGKQLHFTIRPTFKEVAQITILHTFP